jgi:hypothetical protein
LSHSAAAVVKHRLVGGVTTAAALRGRDGVTDEGETVDRARAVSEDVSGQDKA